MGESSVTHNYTVHYEDGSSDFVSDNQYETAKSTMYSRTILGRNAEGKETTLTKQQT